MHLHQRQALPLFALISTEMTDLSSSLSLSQTTEAKGDRIRFAKGEFLNLGGVVTDVRDNGVVMVHPDIEGFDESVECSAEELMKSFKAGDKVMVIDGTHAGEKGMLIQVNKPILHGSSS